MNIPQNEILAREDSKEICEDEDSSRINEDLIIESEIPLQFISNILKESSKYSIIMPKVEIEKSELLLKIASFDENQIESIDQIRKLCEKKQKMASLEDVAIELAVQRKVERLWAVHATRYIEASKKQSEYFPQAESALRDLIHLIRLIINSNNIMSQQCCYLIQLWKESKDSPSFLEVIIQCDNWELCYGLLLIFIEIKFEDQNKDILRPSIINHTFEEQINLGFFKFINVLVTLQSIEHFSLKSRYQSIMNYSFDKITLFRRQNTKIYQVSNSTQLCFSEGDYYVELDTSLEAVNKKRKTTIWEMFLDQIGREVYLQCCIEQKQITIFEAFLEYKIALLCRQNFIQSSYFYLFLKRGSLNSSTAKFQILLGICSKWMKKEMKVQFLNRLSLQNNSFIFMKDVLQSLEKTSYLNREKPMDDKELREAQNDPLFRLVWDIVLFEFTTSIYYLQENAKVENNYFGKIEEFLFNSYFLTKNNSLIYSDNNRRYPNNSSILTASGFFNSVFQSFKNTYDKLQLKVPYEIDIDKIALMDETINQYYFTAFQSIIDDPQCLEYKAYLISSNFVDNFVRYPQEQFKKEAVNKIILIFNKILDTCISTSDAHLFSESNIQRFTSIFFLYVQEPKKTETFTVDREISYYENMFDLILSGKGKTAAYMFGLLLEQCEDVVRQKLIEMFISSKSEKLSMEKLFEVCLKMIEHYKLKTDLFLQLMKLEQLSISSKLDIEKNSKFFSYYMKNYFEMYLNKGFSMLHNHFFSNKSNYTIIRSEQLKLKSLENLHSQLQSDLQDEISYFLTLKNKELKFSYQQILSIKYCMLCQNIKSYYESFSIQNLSMGSVEDKIKSKEDIIPHAIMVYKILLTCSNIFTHKLHTLIRNTSYQKQALQVFTEQLFQPANNELFLFASSLFEGFNNKEINQNIKLQNYILTEKRVDNLFANFKYISEYYFNKSQTLSDLQSLEQAQILQEAIQVESIAYVLKIGIKQLADSDNKPQNQLVKYQTNICSCLDLGGKIMKQYANMMLQFTYGDRYNSTSKIQILNSLTDPLQIKRFFKSISCFYTVGILGLNLNLQGIPAFQLNMYSTLRDSLTLNYCNVIMSNKSVSSDIGLIKENSSLSEQMVIKQLLGIKYFGIIKKISLQHYASASHEPASHLKDIFFENSQFLRVVNHIIRSNFEFFNQVSRYESKNSSSQTTSTSLSFFSYKLLFQQLLSPLVPQFFENLLSFLQKRFPLLLKPELPPQCLPLLEGEGNEKNKQKVDQDEEEEEEVEEDEDEENEGGLFNETEQQLDQDHWEEIINENSDIDTLFSLTSDEKRWRLDDFTYVLKEEGDNEEKDDNLSKKSSSSVENDELIECDYKEEEIYGEHLENNDDVKKEQNQQASLEVEGMNDKSKQIIAKKQQKLEKKRRQIKLSRNKNILNSMVQLCSLFLKNTQLIGITNINLLISKIGTIQPNIQCLPSQYLFCSFFHSLSTLEEDEGRDKFKAFMFKFYKESFQEQSHKNIENEKKCFSYLNSYLKSNSKINKLLFLEVTLISSTSTQTEVLERTKIILDSFKDDVANSESQNESTYLIKMMYILVTVSDKLEIVDWKKLTNPKELEDKITSVFSIIYQIKNLFHECSSLILKQNLDSEALRQSNHKNVNNAQEKLALRLLSLSLEMILMSGETSIKQFVKYNILSIMADLKLMQTDQNKAILIQFIYCIYFEIFNTESLFKHSVEYSIKSYLFNDDSKPDNASNFGYKYSVPIDINAFQISSKELYQRGPREFMEAFDKLISIEKEKKQDMKCYLRQKYYQKWCFLPKFEDVQQLAIEQLYQVCNLHQLQEQLFSFMLDEQKTVFGSRTQNCDQVFINVLNKVIFGKIILCLMQHFPCLAILGEIDKKYEEILIDFMISDSMGMIKPFIDQYMFILMLHQHSTSFLEGYWIKYISLFKQSVHTWRKDVPSLQKFLQQLHMIEVLQKISTHLRYSQSHQFMKEFLNIFASTWKDDGSQQDYCLDNVLNIPAIFQVFYENYIYAYLQFQGFDPKTVSHIYSYLRELKYSLHSTSFGNYENALNVMFPGSLYSETNLDINPFYSSGFLPIDTSNSCGQLPSQMELQFLPSYIEEEIQDALNNELPFYQDDQDNIEPTVNKESKLKNIELQDEEFIKLRCSSKFQDLSQLSKGVKINFASFPVTYQSSQGCRFYGEIINKFSLGLLVQNFQGRDLDLIVNDFSQFNISSVYYKFFWKFLYNNFMMNHQTLVLKIKVPFNNSSNQNIKIQLRKEINKLAFTKEQTIKHLIKKDMRLSLYSSTSSQQLESQVRNKKFRQIQYIKKIKNASKDLPFPLEKDYKKLTQLFKYKDDSQDDTQEEEKDKANQKEGEFISTLIKEDFLFQQDENGIRNNILQFNQQLSEQEIEQRLDERKRQVNTLFSNIKDRKVRIKAVILMRRYFFCDIKEVVKQLEESITSNSAKFIKYLLEISSLLHNDVLLSSSPSLNKLDDNNTTESEFCTSTIREFLLAFSSFFPSQNLFQILPLSSDIEPILASELSSGKKQNFLTEKNQYMEKKESKHKFCIELAKKIQDQEKRKQDEIEKNCNEREQEKYASQLIQEKKITIEIGGNKETVTLDNKHFNIIFSQDFESNCLIEFPSYLIDFAFNMQEQITNEEDLTFNLSQMGDQLQFNLIFLHHFANRKRFMERIKQKIEGLQNHEEMKYNFNNYQLYFNNEKELRNMLANRFLIIFNFFLEKNSGIFELFLESDPTTNKNMITNFILQLGNTPNMIKNIQKQKSINGNYTQFVYFYQQWHQKSISIFKDTIEPFLTSETKISREKQLITFLLEEDFQRVHTQMIINNLNSNWQQKINFHVETKLIEGNCDYVFKIISKLTEGLIKLIEQQVSKLLEVLQSMTPMSSITTSSRDQLYAQFFSSSQKYLDSMQQFCEKQLFLAHYTKAVYKLILSHYALNSSSNVSSISSAKNGSNSFILNYLRQQSQLVKQNIQKIFKETGYFTLCSNILLFSKQYDKLILDGLIYNEKIHKYFSPYSYFGRVYQTIFFLHKFFHSDLIDIVENISEKACQSNEDNIADHEIFSLENEKQKTDKLIYKKKLPEDEGSIIIGEFNKLLSDLIHQESVIYFCIARLPQDFMKVMEHLIPSIQQNSSLFLKKAIVISHTKYRVRSNHKNQYQTSQTITIDRTKLVKESISALLSLKNDLLSLYTLYVRWKGESGIDEGGLRREWFCLLFQQMLNPDFGLFIQTKPRNLYLPNPLSFVVPDHLVYFKLFGIMLGKVFIENFSIQASFAKSFLKLMLSKSLNLDDLKEVDPELFKNLDWVSNNKIASENLWVNFSVSKTLIDQTYEIDLKENGRNIEVDDSNKKEYLSLLCNQILNQDILKQTLAIKNGFFEVVCKDHFNILTEDMLFDIFQGSEQISVEELKQTIQLVGYTKEDKQIIWLFDLLETFTEKQKSSFIQFITGSMNLPYGGFQHFPIVIQATQKIEKLPVGHTCSNQLDLPNYQTRERLVDAVCKAIFECEGFELA